MICLESKVFFWSWLFAQIVDVDEPIPYTVVDE